MRIALVVTGGFDQSGRTRIIPSLLWLAERIAARHELFVYVLRYLPHPRRYRLLGATIQDLGSPEGLHRQYSALAAALQADGPFDVAHAYWALPAGLATALAAAKLKVPAVLTLDSGELVSIPEIEYGLQANWRQRLGVSTACRMATRITVCTESYRRMAARARQIDVIPLGVDTSRFHPPPQCPEGPPWRLIHVASLNRVKNQPLLIDAFRHLVASGLDVHLDIVGEDTLGGAIQTMVADASLASRVSFHGYVPSDALTSLYDRAHLAVLTSHHEAAGVVTLEAAACCVPTIGTPVGYVADFAPDAAVAVQSGRPEAFAAEITRLLQDRAERDRLASAAYSWAVTHDADWTAEMFDRLYQATAAAGASSGAERSRPLNV